MTHDSRKAEKLWYTVANSLNESVQELGVDNGQIVLFVVGGLFIEACEACGRDPVEELCRLTAAKRRHVVIEEMDR